MDWKGPFQVIVDGEEAKAPVNTIVAITYSRKQSHFLKLGYLHSGSQG